jgi:fibronectin-binding autotransporter adhesin
LKTIHTLTLTAGALTIAATSASAGHTLGYQFNDLSGPAAADGGASTNGAPFLSFAGDAMLGGAGSGVSGFSYDRAYDGTSANTMGGVTSAGGRAQHSSDVQAIDTLTSFTLAGWFKTDSTSSIGNNATIFNNNASATSGYNLAGTGATPGSLTLSVNNGSISSGAEYFDTQSWVFFAVTYDGTAVQPGPNVSWYKGTQGDSVSMVSIGTMIAGAVNDDGQALTVGGENPFGSLNTFAFDGFLDNLRIWDEILDGGQLEGVRMGDLNPVPTPGSMGLLAMAGLISVRRRR